MDYEKIILQLTEQLNQQVEQNKNLTNTVASLQESIKELQETIKELRRQLNQNSQNSSKPPSSDGYSKPNPKSQRQKSGKKPGGQAGHKGSHIELPRDPDDIMKYLPEKCKTCPLLSKCVESGKVFTCKEKRYTIETVVSTKVTEHQVMEAEICECGYEEELRGEFPADVKAYIQYGDSISIFAGLLSTHGAVSISRINDLMSSLFDIKLSTGTISSMIAKCADKVGGTLDIIKQKISDASVAHFDETGARAVGKLYWVHNSSTKEYTY